MATKQGKALRKVSHTKVAEALGAEPQSIKLSKKGATKLINLLNNPPKPNKRLKDAAKRYKEIMLRLPLAPEVCMDCELHRHVMHVIDELGDLHVSMSEDGKHFLIEGNASARDLFWLQRILRMAQDAVEPLANLIETRLSLKE